MSNRFFSHQPIASGEEVQLDDQEAHHLLHVMRANVGTRITLFDGSNSECTAEIIKLGRSDVLLSCEEVRQVSRELPFRLTLAVAIPKGDRQTWLVEKLTELGVTTLIPLIAERAVAQPNAKTIDRLRRVIIAGSKQSGRNRLMEITLPMTLESVREVAADAAQENWIAHPPSALAIEFSEFALANRFPAEHPSQAKDQLVAIGPEGGFTDDEVAACKCSGWNLLSLGDRILRIETAAVAIAARISLGNPSC